MSHPDFPAFWLAVFFDGVISDRMGGHISGTDCQRREVLMRATDSVHRVTKLHSHRAERPPALMLLLVL